MPDAGRTREPCVQRKVHFAHASNDRYRRNTGIPCAMVLTAYSALSPVYRYSIHTFLSLRVVPYLMRRKASRPNRMTIGPGFP